MSRCCSTSPPVCRNPPRGEYELTDAIIALVSAGHRIAGCEIVGRWVDVRDPEVLAALEKERS